MRRSIAAGTRWGSFSSATVGRKLQTIHKARTVMRAVDQFADQLVYLLDQEPPAERRQSMDEIEDALESVGIETYNPDHTTTWQFAVDLVTVPWVATLVQKLLRRLRRATR